MGGQSGRTFGEGSSNGFAVGVVVVDAIVEGAREVAMPCSAAGGVWQAVMRVVRALVLVLGVIRVKSIGRVLRYEGRAGVGVAVAVVVVVLVVSCRI
jgi:hypothetical protein